MVQIETFQLKIVNLLAFNNAQWQLQRNTYL